MSKTEDFSISNLADNVRRLRAEHNWSQSDLAEKAEISDGAVKMIETQRRWPKEKTIRKLAKAFGVEVSSLYARPMAIGDLAGIKLPPPDPTITLSKSDLKELIADEVRWGFDQRDKLKEAEAENKRLREDLSKLTAVARAFEKAGPDIQTAVAQLLSLSQDDIDKARAQAPQSQLGSRSKGS